MGHLYRRAVRPRAEARFGRLAPVGARFERAPTESPPMIERCRDSPGLAGSGLARADERALRGGAPWDAWRRRRISSRASARTCPAGSSPSRSGPMATRFNRYTL